MHTVFPSLSAIVKKILSFLIQDFVYEMYTWCLTDGSSQVITLMKHKKLNLISLHKGDIHLHTAFWMNYISSWKKNVVYDNVYYIFMNIA